MALVSSVREIPLPMAGIRYPEVDLRGLSSGEIIENPTPMRTSSTPTPSAPPSPALTVTDEAICVAVGKEAKEAELTLAWALHNSGGRKIVILHVHQPAQKIPMLGANISICRLEEHHVKAFHEAERQEMHKTLDKYTLTCKKAGVQAEKLYIEMDSIEKGIVELISLHGIKKLVMGAAAKNQYSKRMMEPKSKKAIYVRLQAPVFCHIWFICKGHLIYTREGMPNGIIMDISSPVLPASPSSETEPFSLRRSVSQVHNGDTQFTNSVPDHRRIHSDNHGADVTGISPSNSTGRVTPSRLSVEGSTDGCDWTSRRSSSVGLHFSSCSSSDTVGDSGAHSITKMERSGNELEALALRRSDQANFNTSTSSRAMDSTMHDELYDRLQQYVEEAENSRREAYEESNRRRKAEKDAIEARWKARASENMYLEKLGRRKEIEESLARGKEEVENMKWQLDEIKEKLQIALKQKTFLECQIETSGKMIEEMEQKMFSAVELLQKYKKERDELQMERDNALGEAEELRKIQAEGASSPFVSCFCSEYSFSEIEEATCNFDPTLKIGEGGYGSIYKGLLRHSHVAIKLLRPDSMQSPVEFQQEVR